jgi:hypothetical protein
MTATFLTERKSLARGHSALAVEAAIPVDNPASKNNDVSETLEKKRLNP